MTADVVDIRGSGAMTPSQVRAYREFDAAVATALAAAKQAGVLQGLLVAVLHGYSHRETLEMLSP